MRVILVVAVSLLSCKAGGGTAVLIPEDTSAREALREPKCIEVPDRGAPLIVDWASHQRADLEEAMNSGLAVVHYDCGRLELLVDCRVAGEYGFLANSIKEEVIELRGTDEIAVNLPLSGAKIAADLQRNSSLNLGIVQVGKNRSPQRLATRDLLEGSLSNFRGTSDPELPSPS